MNRDKFIGQTIQMNKPEQMVKKKDDVSSLLKNYAADEMAEHLLREKYRKCIMDARRTATPRVPSTITSEVGALLSPELEKTRFLVFREKFSASMFFPKPKIGRTMPAFTKPDHVTNTSRTFGMKTRSPINAYELIFPKKNLIEVNREFCAFHDKKLISHRHYLPSERINRHYTSPPFNSNDTFGGLHEVNKDGSRMKKCLEEIQSTAVISKVQKEFLERTQSALGKRMKSLCSNVTEDMVLGRPTGEDECDAKAVIENIHPCIKNKELVDAVVHLNKLRRRLFKRHDLHINDLRLEMQQRDILHIGYLPLAAIVEVAHNFHLLMDAGKIQPLVKHFQILRDEGKPSECVDYEAFCRLLQVQYPLPAIPKPTVTENMFEKQTIYRGMCNDVTRRQIECQKKDPILKRYKLIQERIKSANHTTAKDVVSPDIPTRFGLSPTDFEIPRTKEELRRIFSRLLCDGKFNDTWDRTNETLNDSFKMYTVNELRQEINSVPGIHMESEKIRKHLQPTVSHPVKESQTEKVQESNDEKYPKVFKNEQELNLKYNALENKSMPEYIDTKAGGDVVSNEMKKVHFEE